MKSVLVIDDERNIRETLKDVLEDEGYKVFPAEDGPGAISVLEENPIDVILLDLWLPEIGGMDVLKMVKERFDIPVIIISGHGSIDAAVKATKIGAFDFLEKPLSIERVLTVMEHAIQMRGLQKENQELKKMAERQYHMVTGSSAAARSIERLIESCAHTNSRVLIIGENGTGKEVVARRIHSRSGRRERPFVAVNCAAIPQTLIESELFGYRKGAFTGAAADRKGKFELAHTGTIFLDEIADMSMEAQAKVLRVLEEMQVERIGGMEPVSIDVRVMAATNRDIVEQIRNGQFREDLYYRLNVVPVHIPPLRERREDIPELIQHYLRAFADENNKKTKRMSDSALQFLTERYTWPGNIRELKNLVERLTILSRDDEITLQEVEDNLPHSVYAVEGSQDGVAAEVSEVEGELSLKEAKEGFEKRYILSVLDSSEYNVSQAARVLKIERSNLYKLMKRLGIKK
jgi:two-component system nitrogen regulation response regulator NtrX